MLYQIAHYIRAHFAFFWDFLEWINSCFFELIYLSKLRTLSSVCLKNNHSLYNIREAELPDAYKLSLFFHEQPESAFAYFKPHGFDEVALRKLICRKSFLIYIVEKDSKIVGYFFLRSFCNGTAYLGKMVDYEFQGKGIGKLMCQTAMDISIHLGLRMFESINKKNIASMKSSAVLKQVIVKELKDGDLLIEDLPLEKK